MDPITTSTLCVSSIGLVSAGVLAVADKFLTKPEDPRVGKVTECLSGANCGGCGYAGCADYARAIVFKGAPVNKCAPGGAASAKAIAAIMGCEAGEVKEPMRALVCCRGTHENAVQRAAYNGITDCASAQATAGGAKACTYGCLGFGSCTRVCPTGAIAVRDGVAVVDKALCIACGKCVAVCPRHIIKLVPAKAEIHVLCSSQDKGPVVRKVCKVGCIGCRLCTKTAGEGMVVNGFLASVDYSKPFTNPDETMAKCPGHCIQKA
jgi:electron transport complex protein RnfB